MHTRTRKRVRLANDGALQALKRKLDVSSQTHKCQARRNEPKTAEYKSFRKIFEEATTKLHANQKHNQDLISSTVVVEGKKEEVHLVHIGSEESSPFCIKDTPITAKHVDFNLLTEWSRSPGQGISGGLFHEKRCEIVRCSAEALSIKVEELASGRHDFIPKCLQRLGTGGEKNKFKGTLEKDMQLNLAWERTRKTNGFDDTFYSTVHLDDLVDELNGEDVTTTSVKCGSQGMLKSCCSKDANVIPNCQENAENCTWKLSEEMGLNCHNKLDFLVDFERSDSLMETEIGFNRDYRHDGFHLGATEVHYKYQNQTDPLMNFPKRDLPTDWGSNLDLSTDFAAFNSSVDISDISADKKHEVSLYYGAECPISFGIIPYKGYSSGKSFRTCKWRKLLKDDKLCNPNESFEYRDQSERLLLGWKNSMGNELCGTSDVVARQEDSELPLVLAKKHGAIEFVVEEQDAELLPLTSFQHHDPFSIMSHIQMDCLSWESKSRDTSWVGDCFRTFTSGNYPCLGSLLVNPQFDLQLGCKSLPSDIMDENLSCYNICHDSWTGQLYRCSRDNDNCHIFEDN